MNTASALPVPRKTLLVASITDGEVQTLVNRLGRRFKYARAFAIVAKNQGILTHKLANLVPCNNVPDMLACANRKLMRMGFVVACVDPVGKPKAGNSHHWFVFEMPKLVIDSRDSANDCGSIL